jgi:hypothetical protein
MLAPNYRAVKWVIGSLFCTTAVFGIGLDLYRLVVSYRIFPEAVIDTIVQTSPSKEAISTFYLAELLHLSEDAKISYEDFSVEEAKEHLLEEPLFKEVFLEKRKPRTLYIDYTIRKPVALLADFENTAIDEEFYLFPLEPFFSPKKLPEIYLGLTEYPKRIEKKELDLAFRVIHVLQEKRPFPDVEIKKIDTANAYADSFGKREIVVVLRRGEHNHFLRLSTRNYEEALSHYFEMKEEIGQDKVIDLRIANIAYVEEVL